MKTYKLKLTKEQIYMIYQSLTVFFNTSKVLENINHVEFYNMKSFLKRLHDKLYNINDNPKSSHYKYVLPIDINQHQSFVQVFFFSRREIEQNNYLNALYLDFIAQVDKQEISLIDTKNRLLSLN